MVNVLENLLNDVTFGEEVNHRNLSFIPLVSNNGGDLPLITLDRAMKEDLISIHEIEGGAVVSEVNVINSAEENVLIMEGEHLIGAKQNRVVNKTIIVPPRSEIRIPVSCTERGRWHFKSGKFFGKSRNFASSSIRRVLKEKAKAQYEVWEKVEESLHSLNYESPTESLEDLYDKEFSTVEEYKNAISTVPSQVGFAAFINGEFAGLDILGSSSLFSNIYPELSSGYIMDAMCMARGGKKNTSPEEETSRILNDIIRAKAKEGKSIGVEKRESVKGTKVSGEFVTFEGKPVHLCVFPDAG